MRTLLGRLWRDIARKIAGDRGTSRLRRVAGSGRPSARASAARIADKLYALHAPEVECIGKGKARVRYEFGVKCSLAMTNARAAGGQFVLGARTCPGNPYDGHTLAAQIDQVERITGAPVQRVYVDRGYRGHELDAPGCRSCLPHPRHRLADDPA